MEISDWVLVVSVIVALVLGIRSLRQIRNIQQTGNRQRLLDEIIKWASDVMSYDKSEYLIDVLKAKDFESASKFMYSDVSRIKREYITIGARSLYAAGVAEALREEKLHSAISHLIGNVTEEIKLLDECQATIERAVAGTDFDKTNVDAAFDNLTEYRKELHKSVYEVIREAVKIKARDIVSKQKGERKMIDRFRLGSSIAFLILGIPIIMLSGGNTTILALGVTTSSLGFATLVAYRTSKETLARIDKLGERIISEIEALRQDIEK